jgi:V/A-type H+-transporting ATPase subunit E
MDSKISELAKSIYAEGVEKAEAEAGRIRKDAEEKAARILEDARKQAQTLLADAKRTADDLTTNTGAEIKLAGLQALAGLKQSIVDLVMSASVDVPMNKLLSDPSALKEIVLAAVQASSTAGISPELQVILPASRKKDLDGMLSSSVKEMLSGGMEIRYSEGFQAGFQIGPKNGSYKVSMTDADLSEFFKSYLKPRTRELLFGR